MNKKEPLVINTNAQNKKIFFNEDGDVVDKPVTKKEKKKNEPQTENNEVNAEDSNVKFNKKNKNGYKQPSDNDVESRWHQLFEEYNTDEFIEIKTTEFNTFEEFCKKCFTEEVQRLGKSKLFKSFLIPTNKFYYLNNLQKIHQMQSGWKQHCTREQRRIDQMRALF